MIALIKRLWHEEPVRLLAIVTGALTVIVGELGADAPRIFTIIVTVLVFVQAEIARSQVSPTS